MAVEAIGMFGSLHVNSGEDSVKARCAHRSVFNLCACKTLDNLTLHIHLSSEDRIVKLDGEGFGGSLNIPLPVPENLASPKKAH